MEEKKYLISYMGIACAIGLSCTIFRQLFIKKKFVLYLILNKKKKKFFFKLLELQ